MEGSFEETCFDGEPNFGADSPKAIAYMEEHERDCEWAKASRDVIALRYLACLEFGNASWKLGFQRNTAGLDHIQDIQAKITARKVVDLWHDNGEKILWPSTAGPASIILLM